MPVCRCLAGLLASLLVGLVSALLPVCLPVSLPGGLDSRGGRDGRRIWLRLGRQPRWVTPAVAAMDVGFDFVLDDSLAM